MWGLIYGAELILGCKEGRVAASVTLVCPPSHLSNGTAVFRLCNAFAMSDQMRPRRLLSVQPCECSYALHCCWSLSAQPALQTMRIRSLSMACDFASMEPTRPSGISAA